ncbi:hypothetical protein ACT7C8_01260 [Bacillus cereus]
MEKVLNLDKRLVQVVILVGYTLVPAVMVKDSDWDPDSQVRETPYYILKDINIGYDL